MDEEDDEKCKKRKTQELTLNQVRDLILTNSESQFADPADRSRLTKVKSLNAVTNAKIKGHQIVENHNKKREEGRFKKISTAIRTVRQSTIRSIVLASNKSLQLQF